MSPVASVASALTGVRGERIALSDVSVSATLRDLLGEVTVSQTYRNDEDVNIEAVYTFPLPLDAVLLDLRVEIGGRTLNGVVVEKKAAEEAYEDAVEAGDAAVMLEAIEPGLYTMNVGNLMPKETARITFVYALVYRWVGDTLRLSLPTTIAPRYGASPHAPHQAPESSLAVENQFSLQVDVFGSLRDAQFVCPSHADAVTMDLSRPERAVITLTQARVVMDRDFVLTVKAPQATHSFAIYGADGEGAAAIASFQPLFPGLRQPRPLELAIVIDCSGSMQGDSIEQARQALAGILDALEPRDRVTIVAFGSTTRRLSDRLLPCTAANLEKARRFAHELKADLGGTAQRAVESLHEHARRTETELRAMVDQAGALLSEIDTIQSSADVLRRTIDEMQSRASHERATTKDAVDQLLVLLVKLKELIARLQERRTLLGQLQEAAREWTEVAKRYRHLTRGGG